MSTNAVTDGDTNRHPWNEQYRAAKKGFPKALRSVWPYMTIGATLGFGLLGFGHLVEIFIEEHPAAAGMEWLVPAFEHLGAGFIVSSIAVLFYEWGAEAKQLLILTERMVTLVERDLQPIIQAVAHDAIFKGLDALEPHLGTEAGKAFRVIFNALHKLTSHGDWNRTVYFEFGTDALTKLAENLNKLAELSAKMASAPASRPDTTLELPKAGAVAAALLSKEVTRIAAGGTYSALSDVDSWRVLDDFVAAQGAAVVEAGAVVRRIFLIPEKAKRDTGATVTSHARYALDWTAASRAKGRGGAYDVRIADEELFKGTVKELSVERHFGVFSNGDSTMAAIAFQVKRDDLSAFTLSGVTKTHELMKDFERLWERLAKQTPADVADILLRSEMQALKRGGQYNVVSDFSSWQGKGLTRFHKACLEGIRERSIEVRRLFVVRDSDDPAKCRGILKRHLQDQRNVKRDGVYDIRICHAREVEAMMDGNWQFGFFQASGADTDEVRFVVAESSKPMMADFYMWSTEDLARAQSFTALWASVGSLQHRVPNIDRDWIK